MSNVMEFIDKAVKVTVSQLADILRPITKSTVCHVIYIVDDSRSKTVKGERQVQKMVDCKNVYLNHDYRKKIITLTGDTNFQAEELKGKTRECGTLLRSDVTNELMLDGKILKSETTEILAYLHKGEFISEAEAIAKELWTPSYYNPKPKNTMGRGTVDPENDFGIINPYLKRIHKIKLLGQWYEVSE